jgi:hypothetical protein
VGQKNFFWTRERLKNMGENFGPYPNLRMNILAAPAAVTAPAGIDKIFHLTIPPKNNCRPQPQQRKYRTCRPETLEHFLAKQSTLCDKIW